MMEKDISPYKITDSMLNKISDIMKELSIINCYNNKFENYNIETEIDFLMTNQAVCQCTQFLR